MCVHVILFSVQLLKSTFKASVILLCETLAKLRGTTEHLTLITKAIFLYLQSARKMQVIDSEDIKPSLREVQSSLDKYIAKSIGKPFGSHWSVAENEINVRYKAKFTSCVVQSFNVYKQAIILSPIAISYSTIGLALCCHSSSN